MGCGEKRIDAGVVSFGIEHRVIKGDQGVTIRVLTADTGTETELLRFDCFDQAPHYHYGIGPGDEKWMLDKTTAGNPIGWTIRQLQERLPQMLAKRGYASVAKKIVTDTLEKEIANVESHARSLAVSHKSHTVHYRGDPVFEAGNVRFGLEFRDLSIGRGMAIHVLSDVAGQEIELLAFDCFDRGAHYHYGPRNQNVVVDWDMTVVPDPLSWTLSQFKSGNLGAMLERAGYPSIAKEMDIDLVKRVVTTDVEPKALAMQAAGNGG